MAIPAATIPGTAITTATVTTTVKAIINPASITARFQRYAHVQPHPLRQGLHVGAIAQIHQGKGRHPRIILRNPAMNTATNRIKDIGPQPQSFDIERATKDNTDYRSVAWSGRYLQVTLMSIPVGGDIGLEAHPETDQFIRLDAGSGRVQMGPEKDKLKFDREVADGWCVLVPAGTWHNITNTGTAPMQVYTVYAPVHHAPDKVQATAAAAEADQNDEPAHWSVQPAQVPDKHG